jgi:hypothetical protein
LRNKPETDLVIVTEALAVDAAPGDQIYISERRYFSIRYYSCSMIDLTPESGAQWLTAEVINPRAMSYGYDRLRFIWPVFIGDTIRVTVTIKEKRDAGKRPGHGIVVEGCEVFNQKQEVVLAYEHLLLVERRSG